MPTVTLNKTVFEKLVGKKLPLDELKDRISMLGTDLEGIEGEEIHVEIFPNRPDLLSEQGFARAFSSFIGVKTGLREYKVESSGEKVIIEPAVKNVRPFTVCAIVKDLQFDEERLREVIQIQEKLHVTYGRNRKKCAIGIYPLEKIQFPIRYTADAPKNIRFIPLDADKEMNGKQILEDHPKGKEFAHLLESMDKYPFFRDANDQILSMPPVINSESVGKVTSETTGVFIECSGHDYETLSICLNIVVTALADMGGSLYSVELEYDKHKVSPNLKPSKRKLDVEYVNKRLGLDLSEKETVKLLAKMGFGYSDGHVLIPAYRADILHQADFVEDIAIAYGYENFKEVIPNVATVGEEDAMAKFSSIITEILIGLQLIEVTNYHLMKGEELNEKMLLDEKIVPLKNSLGDYNHLRNLIGPSLLKVLSENQHNEYPQNIFEIGRVFTYDKHEETGILEQLRLGIALCHEKVDFTQGRQVVDALLSALGKEYTFKEIDCPSFIEGRAAEILIDGKRVGVIGEYHPTVLTNWNLLVPVVGIEIEMNKIKE